MRRSAQPRRAGTHPQPWLHKAARTQPQAIVGLAGTGHPIAGSLRALTPSTVDGARGRAACKVFWGAPPSPRTHFIGDFVLGVEPSDFNKTFGNGSIRRSFGWHLFAAAYVSL